MSLSTILRYQVLHKNAFLANLCGWQQKNVLELHVEYPILLFCFNQITSFSTVPRIKADGYPSGGNHADTKGLRTDDQQAYKLKPTGCFLNYAIAPETSNLLAVLS
jgi:hypothetical protein